MAQPLIVVLGATGNQGGSVVDALLSEKKWKVRGVSRNPDSDKGKALKAKGVEVVDADFNDIQSIRKAFHGAWGVFAITQFWEPAIMQNPELEYQNGKNIVDAAKAENVGYFIYSSLDDVHALSNKSLHVPHFTNKNRVEQHARQSGLKSAFFYPAFYIQNWLFFAPPKKGADGVLEFQLPVRADVGIAQFDVSQTGLVIARMFNNPDKYSGKIVRAVGEYRSGPETAAAYERVTGEKARYVVLDMETFRKFAPADLADMYEWFNKYGYYNGATLYETKQDFPELHTFEDLVRSGFRLKQ
jgi:uncharacterized protein YbjT (DUF2867 family)